MSSTEEEIQEDQSRPTGEINQQVNSFSDVIYSKLDLDGLLAQIGRIGLKSLDGWKAAATTLVEKNQVATFGSTDEWVNPVDQAQYDLKEGPCVEASVHGTSEYFHDDASQQKWPRFAPMAAEAGVHSILSFPLKLDEQLIGALNFYSGEQDALKPGQKEEGLLFAAQASVAIGNMKDRMSLSQQTEHLGEALKTRTVIGQATGVLMAQEGLTSDEAFNKLVTASQTSNIKLRDIAQRIVQVWEEKAGKKP